MRPFDFFAPTTLVEALELLDQYKGTAAVIAGGTDLVLELNEKKAQPAVVIDLKHIPELNYIKFENGVAHIGSMTTHGEIAADKNLKFLAAALQTVTAREFKAFVITVDPALEAQVGPVAKNTLKLTALTGRITGMLKWKVPYVDAKGREKTKTVSGKATGIIIGGVGIGTVSVTLDGETTDYEFTAHPSGM